MPASFPYNWSGQGTKLQSNAAETRATMTSASGSAAPVSALRLGDGHLQSPPQALSGVDGIGSGYNNVAVINRRMGGMVWDLDADTLKSMQVGRDFSALAHLPSMRGYWMICDGITGQNTMRYTRVGQDGVASASFNQHT
jgi:hypothetical protein